MMDPNYVYVNQMGCIYRLTKKRWKKYLQDFVEVQPTELKEPILTLEHYGTLITVSVENITDMGPEQAKDYLADLP